MLKGFDTSFAPLVEQLETLRHSLPGSPESSARGDAR